jgi:hypothetical protein
MKPTARLRFTKSYVQAPEYGDNTSKAVLILQQWWMFDELYGGDEIGEWRDVPLEEEE